MCVCVHVVCVCEGGVGTEGQALSSSSHSVTLGVCVASQRLLCKLEADTQLQAMDVTTAVLTPNLCPLTSVLEDGTALSGFGGSWWVPS